MSPSRLSGRGFLLACLQLEHALEWASAASDVLDVMKVLPPLQWTCSVALLFRECFLLLEQVLCSNRGTWPVLS